MFKKVIIILVAVATFSSLFSCSNKFSANSTSTTVPLSHSELIEALEKKLLELQSAYSISDAESKNQIQKLEEEIAALKDSNTSSTSQNPFHTSTQSPSVFTYKISQGTAIITGFLGDDESIVIPSIVDGLEVKGISSNAFEGYSLRSVIISNGVEDIDWFAFYNCPTLCSITIPESVKSIGYSAFDGAAKSFTIYCHRDSFAHNYAKSYGLTYAFL